MLNVFHAEVINFLFACILMIYAYICICLFIFMEHLSLDEDQETIKMSETVM